ncbi:hypothetical protein [Desulfosarcina alkanivorans]|uniref:hypothetical protein n=1 Tax=Desulfosarcina alkanivorans TaxID=571177 RepID=UPI0012D36146|nr:hypothetical protein [Desulfosarcina alkanivorans]
MGDTTVEPIENYPSLIDCLDSAVSGFALDPDFHSGGGTGGRERPFRSSPYSRTFRGRIKTDAGHRVRDVHLILQRDRYETPGSLVPVTNLAVEAAWQNALVFHTQNDSATPAVFFKGQIDANGRLQPFQSLFYCQTTQQWFHPVCPQCGAALTLCRDDALLKKRGLPAYSDSLDRFLYCRSCAAPSGTSPFYVPEKTAQMPEFVQDADALVAQWKHLPARLPQESDLPCRGCPDRGACFGPESQALQRIVPLSFFPFYMMMFPSPSVSAADFLTMISGGTDVDAGGPAGFLFGDQERQFLEILYLKLTFLAQVCHQFIPADGSAGIQEFDLSLESIGVDLHPPGTGLPAYWNFKARIMDAIGSFQDSPFAPVMPRAPRLHFLGALWFRTLLVNSRQGADAVFTQVGRLVDGLTSDHPVESLEIDGLDTAGTFGSGQVFWVPEQRSLPLSWQGYWADAVRLGFQLVHAGLKTGVAWEASSFMAACDGLRERIKNEMFSGAEDASAAEIKAAPSGRIDAVLRLILEKWKTEAAAAAGEPAADRVTAGQPDLPEADETVVYASSSGEPPPAAAPAMTHPDVPVPEAADWDADMEETVVFSASTAAPPADVVNRGNAPEGQPQEAQWEDDIEETVVLRPGPATEPPAVPPDIDDMEQTVVMSIPPSPSSGAPPAGEDEDLAATMIQQQAAGSPPVSFDGADGDLESTLILNTGPPPATLIQGEGGQQPASSPPSSAPEPPAFGQAGEDDDLDATLIINPADRRAALNPMEPPPEIPADDDLAATLIETPRPAAPVGNQGPPPEAAPPGLPPSPHGVPESRSHEVPGGGSSDRENDDDEIMEQTIIIRSDVKKE